MKKTTLLIALILISLKLIAQQNHSELNADIPATHGMVLIGTDHIYTSHLPMFYSPHNYQIILELTLPEKDKKRYLKDKKNHPKNSTYTIQPETFVLPEMISNPRAFKVNLFRGHFERGGTLVLKGISVTIKQVIYFQKFNPDETKTLSTDFILFGNKKEQFIIHKITNKPDFDQIIEVKTNLDAFINDKKFAILKLNQESNAPIGVSANKIEVNSNNLLLLQQLYLEFSDLKK